MGGYTLRELLKLVYLLLPVSLLQIPSVSSQDLRQWRYEWGQGYASASVANNNGATFSLTCPEGALDTTPSLTIETENYRWRRKQTAIVEISTSEAHSTLQIPTQTGGLVLDLRARDAKSKSDLQDIAKILAASDEPAFTVRFSGTEHSEVFTLRGASTALRHEGLWIFDGCE